MQLGPLDRVQRRLQKLLRRVLLADVLFVEALLGELLNEQLVAGLQVLLGEAGIVNERLVLQKEWCQFWFNITSRVVHRNTRTKTAHNSLMGRGYLIVRSIYIRDES